MSNQCPSLKAAGYFNVGRNMILKVKYLKNVSEIKYREYRQFCFETVSK